MPNNSKLAPVERSMMIELIALRKRVEKLEAWQNETQRRGSARRKKRLAKLDSSVHAEGAATNLDEFEKEVFRNLLESRASDPHFRKDKEFRGDVTTRTDGALLILLGYEDDGEGRQQFRDHERVWFSARKHALRIPHICGEFCSGREFIAPRSQDEKEAFVSDVRWHIGLCTRKGWQPSVLTAVALYDWCQRMDVPDMTEAVLAVCDELQASGVEFRNWPNPEVKVSEECERNGKGQPIEIVENLSSRQILVLLAGC